MKIDNLLTKLGLYGQKFHTKPPDQCEIYICERTQYAMGWCSAHYQRALKLHKLKVDKTDWDSAMNKPIRKKKRNR